ncbi:MAG: hypothetical protein ACXQS2_04770 [Methermicoccaceae archaeon]
MKVLVVTDEVLSVGFRFAGYDTVTYDEFEKMLGEEVDSESSLMGEVGVLILDSVAKKRFAEHLQWLGDQMMLMTIRRPGESLELDDLRQMVRDVTGLDVLANEEANNEEEIKWV